MSADPGQHTAVRSDTLHLDFLIVGGLYAVTALREDDQERVTVYTKHWLNTFTWTARSSAVTSGQRGKPRRLGMNLLNEYAS